MTDPIQSAELPPLQIAMQTTQSCQLPSLQSQFSIFDKALISAVENNEPNKVISLLELGADPNTELSTPLIYAIRGKKYDIIQILIKFRADRFGYGNLAIRWAVLDKDIKIMEMILGPYLMFLKESDIYDWDKIETIVNSIRSGKF